MRKFILLILVLVFMSGCNGVPLSTESLKALGLPETAKVIVDGFTARQLSLHIMHREVANNYFKAVAKSGVTVTPKIEKVGDTVFVTQVVTYIPRPEVVPLPTELDNHPVWQTVNKIAELTLFGYGIHEISNMFSSKSGDTYNFKNSDVYGSFNKSGGSLSSSYSFKEIKTITTDNSRGI
jgi:hypothetical protein